MGHKINPEVFRLGTSVDWKYQVRDPLLANITIYKTIKKMFMEYSAPYINNKIRRHTNPRVKVEITERKNVIIKNPFISRSFFFSHLNISYIKKLHLYIFLFDEKFERKRVKKGVFEKPQYYIAGKFFAKDAKHDCYFRKEIYLPFKKSKVFVFRIKKWRTFMVIFKNKKRRKFRKILIKEGQIKKLIKKNKSLAKKKDIHRYLLKNKKIFSKKLSRGFKSDNKIPFTYGGAWILNTFLNNKKDKVLVLNIKRNLKVLRFLLRLIPLYKNKTIKGRLFFYAILMESLQKIIPLVNQEYIKKKILLFQVVINIIISTMQYKYFSNDLHVKLKRSRFLTFNLYSKILTFTMEKTCFINSKKNLVITYLGMANKNISASLLLNMLIIQLGDYINYNLILRNMVKRIQRLIHIEGFRIILSGRLTRKERAAYIIKNHKSIPLSTYSTPIDFASGFKIMKFGCVGIKIYLRIDKPTTPPYWYIFRFENSLKI